MRNLGFQKLLLISICALVIISVSISSYIAYIKQEKALYSLIINANQEYVYNQAKQIPAKLNEKVAGLDKLGKQFESKPIEGSPQDFIDLTKIIAGGHES